jgi:xylulokinase/glycerol kinase
MKYIIALDLGTSSMRSVLYNDKGESAASFGHEYHSVFPRPSWVEQDPDSWKRAAVDVLFRTAAFMKDRGYAAEGIAVTGQRSSLIPMDKEGNPLRYAIMWQDKRTIEQCRNLAGEHGMESLYRLTGLRINPYFVLPKIRWFRRNETELCDKMRKVLGVQDYVVYCLTGEYVTDYTQAGRTMLMNIEEFRWEEELLRIAGIREDQLPRLVPPGAVAGKLAADFASITGLPSGLPVVISGGDQQNAAVALGVTEPGIVEANTGTGSFVLGYSEKAQFDASCRVLVQASAIAGKWVLEAGIFNTGAIYRWFKEQYCPDLVDLPKPYVKMDEEAAAAGPGSHGVMMIPHFEGSAAPYWNPMAKGLFFNLSLGTTRGDMNRAILEGIAMEISACLELMQELSGPIRIVNVAGGMVKSDLFCRIQAGFYDKPVVRYQNSEASSLGASMVASPALGLYGSLEESVKAMAPQVERVFEPHPKDRAVARKLIAAKKKLYDALAGGQVYEQFMGL